MRRRLTLIGAMMMHKGEADAMVCGTFGTHGLHLHYVDQVIGRRRGVNNYYAMNALIMPKHTVFVCDTYVNHDPSPEQIAEAMHVSPKTVETYRSRVKEKLNLHTMTELIQHAVQWVLEQK